MPSYAILGATGQVGRSVFAALARDPSNEIRMFVRSEKRLYSIIPSAASTPNTTVHEGQILDVDKLAECIAGTDAVFSCIADTDNVPGTMLALDTAHAVVAALIRLRLRHPSAPLPKILVLSSASVNEALSVGLNPYIHGFLLNAMSNVYADLRRAEAYYRLHEPWMAAAVFVQPGPLSRDERQRGHALTTARGGVSMDFLGFADLGDGMVEIARRACAGDEFDWKGVAVVPRPGASATIDVAAPVGLALGLLCHYVPSAYWAGRRIGIL